MTLADMIDRLERDIKARGTTEDGYIRFYKQVHASNRGMRYYHEDVAELQRLKCALVKQRLLVGA